MGMFLYFFDLIPSWKQFVEPIGQVGLDFAEREGISRVVLDRDTHFFEFLAHLRIFHFSKSDAGPDLARESTISKK